MPHSHAPCAAAVPLTGDAELEQLLIQVARVFKTRGDAVRLRILNALTSGRTTCPASAGVAHGVRPARFPEGALLLFRAPLDDDVSHEVQ